MMRVDSSGQPQERRNQPRSTNLGVPRENRAMPGEPRAPRTNRATPSMPEARTPGAPRPAPMPRAEAATPGAVRGALEQQATRAANKKMGPEIPQEKAMKMAPKARKAVGKRYNKELRQQRLKSWTT